jgi:hypothetical protein
MASYRAGGCPVRLIIVIALALPYAGIGVDDDLDRLIAEPSDRKRCGGFASRASSDLQVGIGGAPLAGSWRALIWWGHG